ncbi:hypothetical protein JAN5088_03358 [Jannaschia rubra]|uniref:Uncharacterized protein n=1 Tax=Jannaschia rubra TaxID=282197 RepID=A0A0M6XV01_9RHOB|nr:hypothetical protein JAN5088_03358 [Jannaschia rubra]
MADEIEEREVHLVRVGAGELLAALQAEDGAGATSRSVGRRAS